MHISRIQLENIKSHESAIFEFSRGTTAITGENGAGKTTIIEAIAWVLFDLLDYKKEDFVRRGAKKGWARVTFESGLDEREYVVFRDTAAGYNVTDPRLDTRIADKKEEVMRFLWQHLGLEPGTDLKSLFRQAIGVPQGTFTAIFLEGATERKVAFDRLLKVEEYRQAAEKLRETSRLLDSQVVAIRETIARAEGELTRSETVAEEHKVVSGQVLALGAEIETLTAELNAKQNRVKDLDDLERCVSGLKTTLERSRADKERAELVFRQAEQALGCATEAAGKIEAVRAGHESHIATLGRLKELEREREVRDRVRGELAKTDAAIVNVKAEQKRFSDDLAKLQSSRQEIEKLRPKVAEQATLEKEITELRDHITNAKNADERIESIDRELKRMRERYRENQQKMRDAQEKTALAASLGALESKDAGLVGEIAGLKASLERDQKFQSEIKGGFCPVLSQRCLNLKEGETLENFLSSQFAEMTERISSLETERASVTADLVKAREGHQQLAALETYRQREAELKGEGAELTAKKTSLEARRGPGETQQRIDALTAQLKSLADPAARIRLLEREVAREADIREGLGNVESNLERLESDRKLHAENLDEFKELDEQWTRLTSERDATAEAHRIFLTNEAEAAALAKRKKEVDSASSDLTANTTAVEIAEKDFAAAGVDYDAELHNVERVALLNAERRAAEVRATFDAAKRREAQLATEIARFSELRKSLAGEFKEKERLERVAEATAFIRDTLKEAAPRVARNYVYHVSLEANQMFREITGNAERTLKWGEDYAIMLEEDGYERPFQSFSGGEQMAAALSVRLALLKQLTDIRVAFFDEPTTNMDAERRENLAMQISRITHFDQLFVISHDETFDSYVDNVLAVGSA
ncbi:MAG: AAA family ATPase [Pyrinomonadaceae bacterium]